MSKTVVQTHRFGCERCGHTWFPRFADAEPVLCPKCHSAYWDVPITLALAARREAKRRARVAAGDTAVMTAEEYSAAEVLRIAEYGTMEERNNLFSDWHKGLLGVELTAEQRTEIERMEEKMWGEEQSGATDAGATDACADAGQALS